MKIKPDSAYDPVAYDPVKTTTLVSQVLEKFLYAFCPSLPCPVSTKHFNLTQVCILLFSNIEGGNGGAGTYFVCIAVMSLCFCHFPTQFVHGCRLTESEEEAEE